jgi:hypothetical protein
MTASVALDFPSPTCWGGDLNNSHQAFKGKIINPEVTGNNETGDLAMTGTLKGQAKTADGKSEKITSLSVRS